MAARKATAAQDEGSPGAPQAETAGGPDGGWHVSLGLRLGHAARWASTEADGVVIAARRAAGVTRRVLGAGEEPLAPLIEQLAKRIQARKASDYAGLETDLEFWSLVKRLNHRGAVAPGAPPSGKSGEAPKQAPADGPPKKKEQKKVDPEQAEASAEKPDKSADAQETDEVDEQVASDDEADGDASDSTEADDS